MKTPSVSSSSYPRHRFPAAIIGHAVWLYHVFSLSLRDVELILAERGVVRHAREHPRLVRKVRVGVRPSGSANAGQSQATFGTWTRSSSASTDQASTVAQLT